jgi:hypothetical protein
MKQINSISSDEYKYESCSITHEECDGFYCNTCERAINEHKSNEEYEKKSELEEYTVFEKFANIFDVTVITNEANTIARLTFNDLKTLQEKGIVSELKSIYHPIQLKQWWINLKKLQEYNHLGVPDNIWAKLNYPAVFQFENMYYIIAPRIESV